MKTGSTLVLKGVVVLLGLAALAACIFCIYTAVTSEIVGGYSPILFGICVSAIPFFFALEQTLKLLNYIDTGKAFSEFSVKALKNIKYCAIIISALYVLGMPYIFNVADKDDAPGVAAIGFIIIFASFVIAVFAAVLQKLLKNAIDIKSENDLTV